MLLLPERVVVMVVAKDSLVVVVVAVVVVILIIINHISKLRHSQYTHNYLELKALRCTNYVDLQYHKLESRIKGTYYITGHDKQTPPVIHIT